MDPSGIGPSVTAELSWSRARPGPTAVLQEGPDGSWDELGRTEATTFRISGLLPERAYTFAAAPVLDDGSVAPEVEWVRLRWEVPAPAAGGPALPEQPHGFGAAQDEDLVHFRWDSPTDAVTASMEIRVGASWEDGLLVARDLPGIEYSWPWPSSGPLTFWLKGQDALGRYSLQPATLDLEVEPLDDHVDGNEWDEADAGYPGTAEHLEVVDDVLQSERLPDPFGAIEVPFGSLTLPCFSHFWPVGVYTSPARDLGQVEFERIEVGLAVAQPVENGLPFGSIHRPLRPRRMPDGTLVPAGVRGFCGVNSWRGTPLTPVQVGVEIDTSPTDTALEGSVVWDGWRPYVPGRFRARWVRTRITCRGDGLRYVQVPGLKVVHRRKNKKDEGEIPVEASPGPTDVVFATPFVLAPKVHGWTVGADAGLKVVETAVTRTGAQFRVYSREPKQITLEFGDFLGPPPVQVLLLTVPKGWTLDRLWVWPTEEFEGGGATTVAVAVGTLSSPELVLPAYEVGPSLVPGGGEFQEVSGRTFDLAAGVGGQDLLAQLDADIGDLANLTQGSLDFLLRLRPVNRDAMGLEVFTGTIRWKALGP